MWRQSYLIFYQDGWQWQVVAESISVTFCLSSTNKGQICVSVLHKIDAWSPYLFLRECIVTCSNIRLVSFHSFTHPCFNLQTTISHHGSLSGLSSQVCKRKTKTMHTCYITVLWVRLSSFLLGGLGKYLTQSSASPPGTEIAWGSGPPPPPPPPQNSNLGPDPYVKDACWSDLH